MLDSLYHFFFLFFHFKAKEGLMFCCVHVDEYNIVTHQEQENGCKKDVIDICG